MDTDQMLSGLEANGIMWLSRDHLDQLADIDRRAKYGDESGWRGDPTMCVCINTNKTDAEHGWFEVWGIDARGNPYKAASHPRCDVGLIERLRLGDWQNQDPFSRVMEQNARMQADVDARRADQRAGVVDKMAWAVRRDFAAELGTGRHDVHAVPAFKEKASAQ